jgi:hypothetical protein
MKQRKFYFDFDREVVDALDSSIESCSIGDVPDLTLGIYSNLKLDGFEIVRTKREKNEE